MQDLLGGHVQLMFDAISTSLPSIRSGSIKALAWTGAKRAAILPDLPTIAESGVPGYDTTSWLAMFAPAGTPDDIVQKVSVAVRKILNQPALKEKQTALGIEVVASTPAELDQTVRTEMEKWSALIKKLGIKAE
jgi:tripartite-type tricarboxylate transporter receptor subunit TctC